MAALTEYIQDGIVVGTGALALTAPDKIAAVIKSELSQLAAASGSWFDTLAHNFYDTVCPYFTDCELGFATTQVPRTQQLPQPSYATSTPARAIPIASAQPQQQTIINQPVIERVVETVRIVEDDTPVSYIDLRVNALRDLLLNRMAAQDAANATSFRSVTQSSSGAGGGGGSSSVAASSITGTITNTINSLLGTISDLTSNTITATPTPRSTTRRPRTSLSLARRKSAAQPASSLIRRRRLGNRERRERAGPQTRGWHSIVGGRSAGARAALVSGQRPPTPSRSTRPTRRTWS